MIQLKLLALCSLLGSGLVLGLGCNWDRSTDPNQGLDPNYTSNGARDLGRSEVPDPESCRTACCEDPDCDLALVGLPADGGRQCVLVNCGDGACTLQPSTQFQVFRKTLRVVPLAESDQTRTDETNNGKQDPGFSFRTDRVQLGSGQ